MHRFFVDIGPAERAFLTGEQARQIATVLRLQPGERIILIADRVEHEVELQAVAPAQVTGKVVARRPVATELAFQLTLAVPVLKGDRSEEVIEAASQLGVSRFVPFVSARSIVRELSDPKYLRWSKIAREAAETAHRGAVPRVEELVPWGALFARLDGQIVVCWEEATGPHLLDASRGGDVSLVVGPEGGLTAEEIDAARAHGAAIASLGKRILRAETAGIAAVAILAGARDRR
ncbi:MAG TPA: RsmE family RNA methyltransferase [Candidatus Limnocylindria bacterium]|nr:RsmE family RNA methyltransferase [Candidatus Limnocylindria bacterium]